MTSRHNRTDELLSLALHLCGWYGVEIGWDVETSTSIVVTAHASALSAV